MAITTRQTNLLVNQDWTTLYQSFQNADFQSYDFETIRKSMIDYLRSYYPEDFNDFTESSEYVALIDLIAFLGQSLAFRTDLNARENFFDTAERRDSILRLARLINYNASRNTPASGFLKIDSVNTTENVFDSNGLNLSNLLISWNDTTNEDWQEQFTTIFNAALINNQVIGNPGNTQNINGIMTSEYSVNLVPGVVPQYGFSASIAGANTYFEAVSATSVGQSYIYEVSPAPNGKFNILHQNDNLGNGSINTGYFVYFKQGQLQNIALNLQESLPNRTVSINYNNINNTDVWLYQLDNGGNPSSVWASVPAVAGLNVIYNQSVNRNLYQINTRSNDQIDLVFGDGAFANIPKDNFKLYYRVSNGLNYKITPDEMQNVTIPLTYVSRNNTVETLTITASLHYTVNNASSRELIDSIRQKAPQQYYTQNRMITGEDYNLFPFTNFSDIIKVKAVNRTSSGISRYLDVLDVTGKYSSTNIYCDDGYLYQSQTNPSQTFTFNSINDINNVIYNTVLPILRSTEVKQFYYANYARYQPAGVCNWLQTKSDSGTSTGNLTGGISNVLQVGYITNSTLKYITTGSLLRFNAGPGQYFNAQNIIITGTPVNEHDKSYIYASVVNVQASTTIQLSQVIPTGAVLDSIIPVFKNDFTNSSFVNSMINLIKSYKNFGIRYDVPSQSWSIIAPEFLSLGDFSLANTGNTQLPNSDSSWTIAFTYNGVMYNLVNRSLQYLFLSNEQTRFYFDPNVKVFDSKTGSTVIDQVNVLGTNTYPDSMAPLGQTQQWYIYNNVIAPDGYIDNTQVLVTFPDNNNSGIPNDPDLFNNIINPADNLNGQKYVFFKQVSDMNDTSGSFITTQPMDNNTVVAYYSTQASILANQNLFTNGQLFYATAENKFYLLTIDANNVRALTLTTSYVAKIGRQNLQFQYKHNSPNDRRIDPSPNNIMDLYILTSSYANNYIAWIQDTTGKIQKPSPPTNDQLKLSYGSGPNSLENYKALSDTIVYNAGVYKPLFGRKADPAFQCTFKVVKNPNLAISDNDVISATVAAINTYFNTTNWNFGETFYFSELATYLHNTLAPNVASIIIVPTNTDIAFGGLMQINANPNEILISSATAENVQIISAITAAQINQTLAGTNITV
jgi:hypothetical protein